MSRRTAALTLCVCTFAATAGMAAQDEAIGGRWAAPPFWTPPPSGPASAARTALGPGPSALPFFAVSPCRLADTRGNGFVGAFGPPLVGSSTVRDLPVTGSCGIPASAQAVSFNFTVVNALGAGFLLAFPSGSPVPRVSTLNFTSGETVGNAAIVGLGAGGAISAAAGVSGFDLVVDVNGYYAPAGIVTSVNGLQGAVAISPGADVTIGGVGQTITVSASSSTAADPGTIVKRDGSGNVAANVFTGNLAGNAASATTATNAVNATTATTSVTAGSAAVLTGPLAGDVAGTQAATSVVGLRGVPISPAPPASDQVLTFDGAAWAPATPFIARWAHVFLTTSILVPPGANVPLPTLGSAAGIVCNPVFATCVVVTSGTYSVDFDAVSSGPPIDVDVSVDGLGAPGTHYAGASVAGRAILTLFVGDSVALRNAGFSVASLSSTNSSVAASMRLVRIQ